ncbi:cullin-4A [Trichonephila clavipes]|nr:cullin-4A [Trichonephila clavipes]
MCETCLADELLLPINLSPTCLPELWKVLLDEWCNILHDQIDNLILSMPMRCTDSTASSGLGSNRGEDMDVCKCIVHLGHGGTINSRQAVSHLVRLEKERWEAPDPHPQSILPLNWGRTELNCTVTCMVLKDTTNDRRTSSSLS